MILNLYTYWPNSPSWIFYKELFLRFKDKYKLELNFNPKFKSLKKEDKYKSIGIIFGNIKNSELYDIKKDNLIIGRLEPRAASKQNFENYNFIINNSLESQDYFAYSNLDSFVLPTFPQYNQEDFKKIKNKETLVLGYHGNCIHIVGLMQRIYKELINYSNSNNQKIILKIMSNKKIFKRHFPIWYFNNIRNSENNDNFKIDFFDYDPTFMSEFMSDIDIGICPQLAPLKKNIFTKIISSRLKKFFQAKNQYIILRYKETSNIGRLAIFSQFKIPVISDPCPSSCSIIGMNEAGLIALSEKQWIKSIDYLKNNKLKSKMGFDLNKRVNDLYSDSVLYRSLINFLENLIAKSS
tara:strand:- start:546 stop:1601 length:1056 start_codon:yes stop_codon:yes gene_type:complete